MSCINMQKSIRGHRQNLSYSKRAPKRALKGGQKRGREGDRKRGGARLRVKGTRTHRSRLRKTIYHLALLLNPST